MPYTELRIGGNLIGRKYYPEPKPVRVKVIGKNIVIHSRERDFLPITIPYGEIELDITEPYTISEKKQEIMNMANEQLALEIRQSMDKSAETYDANEEKRLTNRIDQLKKALEEEKTMNTKNMFNGLFGKIAPGMCKLSMSGGIAVKTSNGYKSYNLKTERLTNCDNFVFGDSEEMFFVIPTSKAEKGDIILVNGSPKCVIEAAKNRITVINYEDSTVDTIIPERHVFMGNTYFYSKIVSMFGNCFGSGKKGINKVMSYMMMSEMLKGGSDTSNSGMSAILPFMMMNGGGMGDIFEGMFDFDLDSDTTGESEAEKQASEG